MDVAQVKGVIAIWWVSVKYKWITLDNVFKEVLLIIGT